MAREKARQNRKYRENAESPSAAKEARKKNSKRPVVIEPKQTQKPSKALAQVYGRPRPQSVGTELSKNRHATRLQTSIVTPDARVEKEKAPRVKKMVSAAGIFERNKGDARKHRKDQIILQEKPAENGLSAEYHEYLEEARQAIDKSMLKSFDDVHEKLKSKLASSRRRDEDFIERLSESAKALAFPIAEEQVMSTFNRNGEQVTETVIMGQRIAEFRESVEKEKQKLEDLWKQWEDLQYEYIELALDVFGPEAFGDKQEDERRHGYRWEMKLIDLEHGTKVNEITAEAEELRTESLERMMKTEEEMKASSNRENARIFRALMSG